MHELGPPRSIRGVGWMVLAIASFSFTSLFTKLAVWDPYAVAAFRGVVAFWIQLAIFRHLFFPLTKRKVAVAFLLALESALFIRSIGAVGVATAFVLAYTSVVWTPVLGRFVGERFRWSDFIACLSVLFGISLFFVEDIDPKLQWGIGFGVANGFLWALATVGLKGQRSDRDREDTLLTANAILGLFAIIMIATKGPPADNLTWVFVAGLGVITGLGYLFYGRALRHLPTAHANFMMAAFDPAMNMLWVFLILRQAPEGGWTLYALAWIGTTVIVWSAFDAYRARRRTEQ